ncbi:MAG: tRNA epoxyqueuosine(34) reductase QueG [Magnetospirillum sp.]|nr:tRNA epoxyqueuosine(34) reductase QueG [Magnetospirillum sp.]
MTQPNDLIRRKAQEFGFDAVGFASAATDPALKEALAAYIAEGRHGGMAWMEETFDRRVSPTGLWPEVRSIIALGMSYAPPGDALATLRRPDCGTVSVYGRHRDYHDVVKKRLKQLARWMVDSLGGELKVFVDTAPVMEKPLAVQAGLGWRGRHTNLVSRRFGGWLFLGEIYTTLELPADAAEPDHCGRCRACADACPTGALDGLGRIEPRRCISYLTIEHKGEIAEELRPLIGNRIYGCDDCTAVCPWNKFAPPNAQPDFQPLPALTAPKLAELAQLDDPGFRALFAGTPVKRIGRDRFIRNVLIAIGNSGMLELAPVAQRLLDDASPLVRDMAAWAVDRLARKGSAA